MKLLLFLLSMLPLQQLEWTVGWSDSQGKSPETFVPATVPGTAQKDIADYLKYPDYKFGDNYKIFSWMEDVFFTYRTVFEAPKTGKGEKVWFRSKGIDYEFDIILNGEKLFHQEGMFTPVNLDITGHLQKTNTLEVLVYKAPKWKDAPAADRTQASHSVKPPVCYEWDWHPRLLVSGIWDETGLVVTPASFIEEQNVAYTLSEDLDYADVTVDAKVSDPKATKLVWTLSDSEGKTVARLEGTPGETMHYRFDNPQLWWCHDYGTPYLYGWSLTLVDKKGSALDQKAGKLGFRRIRLIHNEGTMDEPASFPKSRYSAPAQFELNGRRIFAKGTNWLAPDIFVGTIKAEDYDILLDKAVKANFNTLRCWGGCAVSKDSFFDLCDEKGILVWQEFPLACNNYPDDRHYLDILEQEAVSIIDRLHPHPCIALFCGGNELFNGWSGMTDQSLPLRLLNSLCYEKAPEIPFNMTSPLNGMAHGCYVFRMDDKTVYDWMGSSHYTAYTEFGMPGLADRKTLESIIPASEMFPPRPGTSWQTHHAFHAWSFEQTWLESETLRLYFGEAADLDELIRQSQLLQSEGYKYIYEEARRKQPYCAMALNWCYNEPWPAAANNSIISWPAIEKPAYYAVAASCRPVCASARAPKFQWQDGEEFSCGLWMLNDSYDVSGERLEMSARIELNDGSSVMLHESGSDKTVWTVPALSEYSNEQGPLFVCDLPECGGRTFKLFVEVKGHPEYNSEYVFAVRR